MLPWANRIYSNFNIREWGKNADKCNKRNIGCFFKQLLFKILSLGQRSYLGSEIMHSASACQCYVKAPINFSFPWALFYGYCPPYQTPFITCIYSWGDLWDSSVIYKNEEAATKWLLVSSATCKIHVKSKWFKTAPFNKNTLLPFVAFTALRQNYPFQGWSVKLWIGSFVFSLF